MKLANEVKVGLMAVVVMVIIAFATIQVGDHSIIAGGGYELKAAFVNAAGLYAKGSVEIAGVHVGVVKEVGLSPEGKALVVMGITKKVHVPKDSVAFLKTKGFLGEAYVEIVPGKLTDQPLADGEEIGQTASGGDVTGLVNKFNDISSDVKEVTTTLKGWMNEQNNGLIAATVKNLEEFTRVMREVSTKNEENLDRILQNMADLTADLKETVKNSRHDIEDSADHIASISQKIDEGRGTLGKLVNDPATVEKLNSSLDSLSEALGGYQKMELGIGYHTEYLSATKNFKNYVGLDFWPAPDEALKFDLVVDPSPDTKRTRRISEITTGGATTTVTNETETLSRDSVLFSAQLAKKFYDFQIRGGIIESKGGLGLDYAPGPLGIEFSAFDFETDFNEKPHLKVLGSLNVTQNFYMLGGMDDPLNPAQKTDYFFGGGFHIVDEEIKSLIGLAKLR